jgi:surface polysaccharide O-acyltransferase-like enzyme
MSLGACIMIKAAGEKISLRMAWLSAEASKVSLGIYLIHPMVFTGMELAWNALGFQTAMGNSILVIPLVTLVNFIFSWIIVFLITKIPILRSIV